VGYPAIRFAQITAGLAFIQSVTGGLLAGASGGKTSYPILIQLVHCWLPLVLGGVFLALGSVTVRSPINRRGRLSFRIALGLIIVQVSGGVFNLIYHRPLALGALHSVVGVVLFGFLVILLHDLRYESGEGVILKSGEAEIHNE